ncbi:MAG: magnesium/cobalt transporter CorA [bacterium]
MRVLCVRHGQPSRAQMSPEALRSALQEENVLLWIDFDGDAPQLSQTILADVFNFHPLAIDDALNEVHLPKVDDWGHYLYLVLRGITPREMGHPLLLPELDIFLGDDYLVTFHHQRLDTLDTVWEASAEDERLLQNGPAYLLYRLIDELVADYIKAMDEMENELEQVEARVFASPRPATQERILGLKHTVLKLRRVIVLQREVLNQLARDQFAVISDEERVYFRDVYDHIIRLYDLVDGLRDLVTGALELYLAALNNRMNDIMKTLTVITTLFMPLSFLTGFFGMNFFQPVLASLGVWTGPIAFIITLLVMTALPILMFLWMRRRAWM